MSNNYETSLHDLVKAYENYYTQSRSDSVKLTPLELANSSASSFIKYYEEMLAIFPSWGNSIIEAINNEIRIINGMTQIYDKPIKVDAVTSKTRWSK